MGYAYIGSFNYSGSEGIHICGFDERTGKLTYLKTVAPQVNAGSVCVNKEILMATDEQDMGYVYVFRINPDNGELTEVECRDTLSANPSCITLDEDGKFAVITHFAVGDVVKIVVPGKNGGFESRLLSHDSVTSLYELKADGSLGRLCDVGWHKDGPSPRTMLHKAYQRPHSRLYAENDLEGNRVYFFEADDREEKLHYLQSIPSGSGRDGARVGAFHPTLPYLYVNYQNRPVIAQYDVSDEQNIRLVSEKNLLDTEETFAEGDNQSELMFHSEKPILYDFVRGKGYALVYVAEEKTGTLRLLQKLEMSCKDPRGAHFTPDGRFILIAGHNDNAVYTLEVEEDGTLKEREGSVPMSHPAAIGFYLRG
ncbi:MAG: lactonase family protein [Lachnospiraceae bacterium]|nr:lactonase family protein [Lachnospiraceae bacterium]